MMLTLPHHLAVEPTRRDLEWIRNALQLALAIEHATLLPYFSALYSLKIQSHTAYNLLRSVAMEEMSHMASVCNILAAIGGKPTISNLKPTLPGLGLPGGAEPDLFFCLASYSRVQLENFMRLECPAPLLPKANRIEGYPTIGSLYLAIRSAIRHNHAIVLDAVSTAFTSVTRSNQVGDNIGFQVIDIENPELALTQIDSSLRIITEQGEGSSRDVLHTSASSDWEESHYCRIAQLFYGRQYRQPSSDAHPTHTSIEKFFRGFPIGTPDVVNTLMVPLDGYEALLSIDQHAADVRKDLVSFDNTYSEMMATLDSVWNGDPTRWWPTLGQAVTQMARLRVIACFNVMTHEIPTSVVAKLGSIYSTEIDNMSRYTDLTRPVFYGPRFNNIM